MNYTDIYFCGIAATVFISVSLTIASIRWFHMCQPYNKAHKYYYPGRPYVTGIYLNALMLVPFALFPGSADAWFLARLYFLPLTILHFCVLIFSYFQRIIQCGKWCRIMKYMVILMSIAMLWAFGMAVWPGEQVIKIPPVILRTILYTLGAMSSGICILATSIVLDWAKRYDADDYSNPEDYPVNIARKWIKLVFINMSLCWAGAITGQRCFLIIVMLLLALSSVAFVISVLHPHRNRPMEEVEPAAAPPERKRKASDKKKKDMLNAIRAVVEEQEAYLDAHLTIQDVADRSGYSRSMLSGLFKAEFGGFFYYINKQRLLHVEAYLKENPQASTQEAALESGFNSRQAYYSFKSKMEGQA